MEYQQVDRWTIAYNSSGELVVAPIMVSYVKKAYSSAVEKIQQTLYEIAFSLHSTIYLASKEKFPLIDNKGNLDFSPTVHIREYIIQCRDICAAHAVLEVVKNKK